MSDSISPEPGPEHARLATLIGRWKVRCTYAMSPSPEPIEAEETVEAFGRFFVRSHFKSSMFGQPFEGSATMGFQPHTQRYVSTWCDTLLPSLFLFEGEYDAATKTLTFEGQGPNPMGEGVATYRTVEVEQDADHRTFDMVLDGPGGVQITLLHYEYERA